MSTREYAIDLINTLSDEQVDGLVKFIVGFSNTKTDKIKEDDGLQSKRRSFEKLNQMIRSVPIEDEKELLREYREEKYGI